MKMDRQQIAGNWNSRGFSCPDKTMAKWEFWHCMREELFAWEWDLLLYSAGSLSAIVRQHALQAQQKATEVGALDVAFLRCGSDHNSPRYFE